MNSKVVKGTIVNPPHGYCPLCHDGNLVKNGKCFDKDGNKVQRYLCLRCGHNTQTPDRINELINQKGETK